MNGSKLSAKIPSFRIVYIALALLLIIVFSRLALGKDVTALMGFIFAAALGIMLLRYKITLLLFLCFAIPLSVQLKVVGGSRLSLPAELICVCLSAFYVARSLLGYRPSKAFMSHPVTVLILIDILWLFLTSCFSGLPEVSFKRLIVRVVYYVTFYFLFYELFRHHFSSVKKAFLLYMVGFIGPILYTLFRHAKINFAMVGSQQLSAPFYFDHTILGACLVFFLPFLIDHILHLPNSLKRLPYLMLLVLFIIATWLSYSRAAWLSIIVVLSLYFAVYFKIKFKTILVIAGLFIVFFLAAGKKSNSFFSSGKQVSHTNDVGMHLKSVSNISTDASNKERINRWKCALRMFRAKPIIGFGPGTYQFFYGPFQLRSELTRISTFTGNKGHAHSEYLNYLSETGLPGLIIFLMLLVAVSRSAYRVCKNGDKIRKVPIAFVVYCGLLTYFIHGFFNGFLEFEKMAMPVFASFAAITLLDLRRNSEETSEGETHG